MCHNSENNDKWNISVPFDRNLSRLHIWQESQKDYASYDRRYHNNEIIKIDLTHATLISNTLDGRVNANAQKGKWISYLG